MVTVHMLQAIIMNHKLITNNKLLMHHNQLNDNAMIFKLLFHYSIGNSKNM